MKCLTKEDIEKFDKDGYFLVKSFYSKDEISQISKWINDYLKRKPEEWKLDKENAYYETSLLNENERILSRIEKFADYHEGFRNLINSEKLMCYLKDLLGESCVLFKEKINFKQPGGNGFRPHQDITSRWDDFASYFMNVLITIDESTLQNGCLEIALGHHKRGLIGGYDRPLQGKDLEGMEFVLFPTSPGDVLFFDCFTPHQSKPNLTNLARRNVYLTYNRISEGDHRLEYLARKEKELPPDNKRGKSFQNSPVHMALYKDNRKNKK